MASSTTLATYLPAGMPVDPAPSATNIYTLCVDGSGDNFVVSAVLENTPPTPGLSGDWSANATCVSSSDGSAKPTCDGALKFCTGSANPVAAL